MTQEQKTMTPETLSEERLRQYARRHIRHEGRRSTITAPAEEIQAMADELLRLRTRPPITDAAVHEMCAYLIVSEGRDGVCHLCPRSVNTVCGEGEPCCFGIALETLQKAREVDV